MARTRRHVLQDILVIALCAMIANCNTWVDIAAFGRAKLPFLREFLELPNGIPSHDTFGRVFAKLDPAALLVCPQGWLNDLRLKLNSRHVAIDGKTLRGSHDGDQRPNALHLVSAWATEARLFLGQLAVDQKSNEITAIPQLLALLDIEGATVTIDAMGCQKEIAKAIVDKQADYVLQVKDNQPTLHQAISDAFIRLADEDHTEPSLRRYKTIDHGHGRVETRQYFIVDVPADLPGADEWTGLKSIGMVLRTRQEGDHISDEAAFYITSLKAQVKPFARAVRGHWGIETTLHWSLDVTFAEDQSRVRKDRGPENLGMLRRLAVSILQQDTSSKASLRGKRLLAGWDETSRQSHLKSRVFRALRGGEADGDAGGPANGPVITRVAIIRSPARERQGTGWSNPRWPGGVLAKRSGCGMQQIRVLMRLPWLAVGFRRAARASLGQRAMPARA